MATRSTRPDPKFRQKVEILGLDFHLATTTPFLARRSPSPAKKGVVVTKWSPGGGIRRHLTREIVNFDDFPWDKVQELGPRLRSGLRRPLKRPG